jgi:3',5'-cyclic AMP phosphodiesterase CpdA
MAVHFQRLRSRWFVFLLLSLVLVTPVSIAQITIAQLSDTHLGDKHAPHAAENLEHAVDMINARHPDAVILSGDIGENPHAWDQARSILKKIDAPLYYAPGNHDVHSADVDRYRRAFGKDYYTFQVKDVTFVVIDSQLLGNYDVYGTKQPAPLPSETQEESDRMLDWLSSLKNQDTDSGRLRRGAGDDHQRVDHHNDRGRRGEHVMIGIQHTPIFHDGSFPDPKPYWVIEEPYRSREMKTLKALGIRHMLVGHWHNGRVFERDGITWHVAPATSWLPWGGELGFAIHTISPEGDVRTEFVVLPGATR